MQIITAGNAVLHFESRAITILRHFNERQEKIQNAVAQLLHVSVLIGRSFVSVNGDALIHSLAVEIFLFA